MTQPIALDLDGVVLRTNGAKHSAMLSLFAADAATRARISAYILANGGVRRDLKIAHILGAVLGHAQPQAVLPQYLATYAAKLEQGLAAAELVPGVREFLAREGFTFFVCSSAPDEEVRHQLQSRGLLPKFAAVFGASVPKADALVRIAAESQGRRPVFFGDAVGDWQAAQAAGTAFVAVTSERDNFEGLPVTRLRDFRSFADVQHCMAAALQQRA